MIFLVAEDNPVNGASLAALLRLRGHLVEWAGDGAGVRLKMPVVCPDAVLLDWLLPDVDGNDLLAELLAAGARVVVLTALGEGDLSQLRAAHPDVRFLQKPVEAEVVAQALEA